MQSIILSLASRYALSTAEVVQEVESAFALQLSQWYRQEVMVFLREGMRLEIVAYGKRNGLPVQHILDLPATLSRRQFKTILENHLATAAVIKQVRLLKSFERRLPEETVESHEEAASEKPPKPSSREAVQRVQADIYGETIDPAPSREENAPPQRMDISSWFDAAGYLAMLKPYINRVEGRRFMAFSMADGLVYFQVKVLEEVARKQAQEAGCMEIATMAQGDSTMRQVLFSVVQHLHQQHVVIAAHLIKSTYFGGYFLVTRKFNTKMRGYYTPFHAEAFGSIAEMERTKPDLLRDILDVSPYTGSDQVG